MLVWTVLCKWKTIILNKRCFDSVWYLYIKFNNVHLKEIAFALYKSIVLVREYTNCTLQFLFLTALNCGLPLFVCLCLMFSDFFLLFFSFLLYRCTLSRNSTLWCSFLFSFYLTVFFNPTPSCPLCKSTHRTPPHAAKGRTNIELREQFILADGVSQSMAAFRPRTPRSNTNTPPSTGPITKVSNINASFFYIYIYSAHFFCSPTG